MRTNHRWYHWYNDCGDDQYLFRFEYTNRWVKFALCIKLEFSIVFSLLFVFLFSMGLRYLKLRIGFWDIVSQTCKRSVAVTRVPYHDVFSNYLNILMGLNFKQLFTVPSQIGFDFTTQYMPINCLLFSFIRKSLLHFIRYANKHSIYII